ELAMRAAALEDAHIVFVTGEIYFEDSKRRVELLPGGPPARLHLVPYLNNMPDVLAASSLVVSRSGASSLAELTALGIPSVLVPSPNVTNNHQEPNARSLADAGAAVMLLEHELTGEALCAAIEAIMGDERRRQAMSAAAHALGMPGAAQTITEALRGIAKRKR